MTNRADRDLRTPQDILTTQSCSFGYPTTMPCFLAWRAWRWYTCLLLLPNFPHPTFCFLPPLLSPFSTYYHYPLPTSLPAYYLPPSRACYTSTVTSPTYNLLCLLPHTFACPSWLPLPPDLVSCCTVLRHHVLFPITFCAPLALHYLFAAQHAMLRACKNNSVYSAHFPL